MSYCLNPDCQKPQNPAGNKFCQNCGSKLLLRGHYRAIKPLGQGVSSRTFLAVDEDIPSKPTCAIKQFFPPETGTESPQKAAERFEREALQLDKLGLHPQIPRLLGFFEQDGRQYLVQEFIEGQNLAAALEERGPFSETEIRALLEDLLPVLQFVHSNSVIHRDIKPENIIRRRQPAMRLVLVDFGSSKSLTPSASLTSSTIVGSPEYIAPEQLEGRAVFASDLYSLGVTCAYLLTQTPPFNLRHGKEWVWRQHLPRPVSASLGRIIDKMLLLSVQGRYGAAEEILTDLRLPPPASWKCVETLTGAAGRVRSVALSPDGCRLAGGIEDSSIKVWNLGTGSPPVVLSSLLFGHAGWVNALAFTPDGQLLVSGSGDRTVKIWNLGTGKLVRTLAGLFAKDFGWVYSLAVSPEGQWVAGGYGDKTVKIWNLATGKLLATLTGHSAWVESVAISAQGNILASGSGDKTVRIWQLKGSPGFSGATPAHTLTGHSETVRSVAISPDGEQVASGSSDCTVKLWHTGTGELLGTLTHSDWVSAVAISPEAEIVAGGGRDGCVQLWNPYTGMPVASLTQHSAGVSAVAFSGDGRFLASGSADGTVKIWRVMS